MGHSMSCCVVCDEPCVDGEFAVETVLFIPNKGDSAYEHLGRFRIELPRIACVECAAEHADIDHAKASPSPSGTRLSLGAVWKNYQSGQPFPFDGRHSQKLTPSQETTTVSPKTNDVHEAVQGRGVRTQNLTQNPSAAQNAQSFERAQPSQSQAQLHGRPHYVPPHHQTRGYAPNPQSQNRWANVAQSHQNQQNERQSQSHHTTHQQQSQKVNLPLLSGHGGVGAEAEADPFDDGFLICTQLVKTGGADQGGLQVGDVFVEFGHYSKKRFPGLKSIANLVRRSAAKDINVVVWRKQEIKAGDAMDDGTGRTVFQKLALKLKPLQSHDADGGGVLGAVINTYPLPEMKN